VSSSAVKVARGSLFLLLGDTFKIPVAFAVLAYMTRLLSLTELGTVMGYGILVRLFQLCSDPGLSSALTVFCARGIGEGQSVRGLIVKVVLMGVCLSSVAAVAMLFSAGIFPALLPEVISSPDLLRFVALDTFLSSMDPYMDGTLLGMKNFRGLTSTQVFSYAINQLTGVIFISIGLGPLGVILGWVIGDSASVASATFLILRRLREQLPLSPINFSTRSIFEFAIPVYGIDLIAFVAESFDKLYVLAAFQVEQLALYGVALSIFTSIVGFRDIVLSVILPHFSEQYAREGKDVLRNEARDASRYIYVIFTPVCMGLAAISGPLLSLYAGPNYSEGATSLMVLCVFGSLALFSSGFREAHYALGKTGIVAIIAAISTVIGITLSLILAQPFGILGIALARGAGSVTAALLLWQGLRRFLSLKLNLAFLGKVVLISWVMFFVVYIAEQIRYSSYLIGVYIGLGIAMYVGLSRALHVFRKRDFNVTRELLGPKLAPLVDFAERIIGSKSQ
jgi:O-antigen/teichoic acid export membrane protein